MTGIAARCTPFGQKLAAARTRNFGLRTLFAHLRAVVTQVRMSRTPQSQTPRPVPSAPGVLRATPPLITASPSAPSADTMRRRSSASLLAPPVVTVPVRRQAGGSSSLAVPPSGDRPDRRGSTTPLFSAASTPGGVGPTRISQPQALPTDSGSLQEVSACAACSGVRQYDMTMTLLADRHLCSPTCIKLSSLASTRS